MRRVGFTVQDQLRSAGWFQFRNLLAGVFARQGYRVEMVPRSDAMKRETDLILRRDSASWAVRCAHGDAWQVGLRQLRRFDQARVEARLTSGIVVSVAGFTDEVYDHLSQLPIEIWDMPVLVKLLEDTQALGNPTLAQWLHDDRRLCPYCEENVGDEDGCPEFEGGTRCRSCPNFQTCSYTLGLWAEHARRRQGPLSRKRPSQPPGPGSVPTTRASTLQMLIGPREATQSRTRLDLTHMVSLLDPDTNVDGLRPAWIRAENHHIAYFHDVRDPDNPLAPKQSTIRSLLHWLQDHCGPDSQHRLWIHCDAGVGRSPAVGYLAWAIHLGPGHEQEAWDRMMGSCLKKRVLPNGLVISVADRLLGRAGALCAPLQRWSIALPCFRLP